jgi:hypothetical protein
MNKNTAMKIVIQCAKIYREELEGMNFLFIFGRREKCDSFETVFPA